MQIEYHKWFSPILGHDMELKVYGYYGKPALVFPSQQGRFHDFEDWGMTNTLARFIESGQLKLFTVDSLDSQSWANWDLHPADRARRHQDYDHYIVEEVVPFPKRIKLKPGETLVYAAVEFNSEAHRNKVMKAIMADPAMGEIMVGQKPPFDYKRMVYGGFKILVDL